MGVEKNIVAIELGSSSVRAIIGQKKPDGSLQVIGFEKENAPDSIHKGVVYNIDKTVQAIVSIKKRLEERGHFIIDRVCVGVSGQSLRTVANSVHRQFDIKVTISDEIVDNLLDENRAQVYPAVEILDVVPQEYRVGSSLTHEPVGIMADRIEGYYKNIVARKSLRESIGRCLQGAKLEVADYFIAPLLLSNYILTDTEKRSGCALVDFGAETTTVAVYEKNILRHLAVIPLGGSNLTADIATSLHIEYEEAEKLKLTYGSAYTEEEQIDASRVVNISNDRTIELKKLLNRQRMGTDQGLFRPSARRRGLHGRCRQHPESGDRFRAVSSFRKGEAPPDASFSGIYDFPETRPPEQHHRYAHRHAATRRSGMHQRTSRTHGSLRPGRGGRPRTPETC